MIDGHGDDLRNYGNVRINFSSNIYAGFSHHGLFGHLKKHMHLISNYPEPSPVSLEKQIADINGVGPDNMMVTNGATEGIYLIAKTFSNCEAVIPQPTFSEYTDAWRINKKESTISPLIKKIWWYCTPNNPTGHVMPKPEMLDLIMANPDDVFVIDASYAAYTKVDIMNAKEVASMNNVIMLGSMTKDYGVPGLRLGYIVGNTRLLDRIKINRMPWSVNALAVEAGHYLLVHRDEYNIPVDKLISERRRLEQTFNDIGISTSPSDSHILLCRLAKGNARDLKNYLVDEHGILIRDASNFETLTPQHFRVAMQNEEQNSELIKAISQWMF